MGLFGGNSRDRYVREARRVYQYAPGTKLSYDPTLIERFKGHHRSLLKLFTDIQRAADQRDFAGLTGAVERFKRVLQEHLLEENLRLYAYLTKCLESEPENHQLMRDMKSDMVEIGRKVNQFITHYTKHGIHHGNIEEFESQLETIGNILTIRIQREEESLYTLYMPPDQYI
jgi:regulator of sigma D